MEIEPSSFKDRCAFVYTENGNLFRRFSKNYIPVYQKFINSGLYERLIKENLLDYIAMDIKAPPDKYPLIAGVKTDVEKIQQSAKLIMESKIDYEFRTTVLKSMLNFEDFEKIGSFIRGARRYYLQKFVPSKALDENLLTNYENYTNDELMNICELLRLQVNFVHVR